jgi:DNA-binding MarR family transcriptional regulator
LELGWLDERDRRAWWAFLDLWRALGSGMERQLASVGVSGADYQLLAPLAEAGAGLRPRDLAAASGWDRSRVAHQLRRMEQRGLVERENLPGDRRGVTVRLTESGRHVLQRAAPGHVEWVRTHFIDVATREELDALTALARRVVDRLNETPETNDFSAAANPR